MLHLAVDRAHVAAQDADENGDPEVFMDRPRAQEQAAQEADGIIQIPMLGMIQSLNVSVACAIVLYEALRQRFKKGHFAATKFPTHEFERMFEEWKKK